MTETRFEEMKRYVRLGEDDARILLAFRPIAAPHFHRVTREFYERIREHEEAHAVFTGEAQIERLQRSLVSWMHRILSGSYDEAYAEETRKIGRVHVRVGLPQRYMFTAMALIRVSLEAVAEAELATGADRTRAALTRVLDLELAIMVDSYREHLEDQARRRDAFASQSLRTDLARALQLYATALDVTPNLVVGLDARGVIRLFNREAQASTSYAVEDAIGTSFLETLVPEELRTKDGELIRALLEGLPQQLSAETTIKTRAGRLRDVAWRFTRIDGEGPEDIVLFAIGTDITHVRIAAQRERQQQKLASIGTLAAGLAHEIRNPLNGAQLHLSFLRRALEKTHADPEMLEATAVVSDEIKRLANLVTEFLDFARPRALLKSRIVVQTVLARTVELLASTSSGVTIAIDAPPQDLVLFADGAKVEQVLLNVVQNAVEAFPAGGPGSVVVRARRQPRAIVIVVEDDGPGLASPGAPVFDAFYSTKATGSGLGLAISHRIVTDHGGTIDVESRPGRTSFRLTLPIGDEVTE